MAMAPSRPVSDMLTQNLGRLRLHVPGHKGNALFGGGETEAFDTTELPVTDDLYAPAGAVKKAQERMAAAYGAAHTLMLTGGSTAGILTMLLYAASPGDTVILPRNAHHSCLSACILGDLRPVYVPLKTLPDGYGYAPEAVFLKAIAAHPEARAVLVTRPDYYGGMVPLARIAEAAHEKGMRLLVDEAHGAHLNWLGDFLTAAANGADLWVQSAHKTLPALTAGAMLHLAKGEDARRALQRLRLVQTSSPAFYLMKSLDDAVAWMEENGKAALAALRERLAGFRPRLADWGLADAHDSWRALPMEFDPTRLVIASSGGGYALASFLSKQGIDVEMADAARIVCVLTVMDGPETFSRLSSALEKVPRPAVRAPLFPASCPLPRQVLPPRQAAFARQEPVPLSRAAGRICGVSAGLYPPGTPIVAPGEEITAEVLEILLSAPEENRFGLWEGQLVCVAQS